MRIQHGIQRENTDGAVIKEECKTLKSQLNDRKGKLNDLDAEVIISLVYINVHPFLIVRPSQGFGGTWGQG